MEALIDKYLRLFTALSEKAFGNFILLKTECKKVETQKKGH